MPLINDYAFGGGGGLSVNGISQNYNVTAGEYFAPGDFVRFEGESKTFTESNISVTPSSTYYMSTFGDVSLSKLNDSSAFKVDSRAYTTSKDAQGISNIYVQKLTYSDTAITCSTLTKIADQYVSGVMDSVPIDSNRALSCILATGVYPVVKLHTISSSNAITTTQVTLPTSVSTARSFSNLLFEMIRISSNKALLITNSSANTLLATVINVGSDNSVSCNDPVVLDTTIYNIVKATKVSDSKILVLGVSPTSSKLILLRDDNGSISVETTADITSKFSDRRYTYEMTSFIGYAGGIVQNYCVNLNPTKYLNKAVITYAHNTHDTGSSLDPGIGAISVDCTNGISIGTTTTQVVSGIGSYNENKLCATTLEDGNIYFTGALTRDNGDGSWSTNLHQSFLLTVSPTLSISVSSLDWSIGYFPPAGTNGSTSSGSANYAHSLYDFIHVGGNRILAAYSSPTYTSGVYNNIQGITLHQMSYTSSPQATYDSNNGIFGVCEKADNTINSITAIVPSVLCNKYNVETLATPIKKVVGSVSSLDTNVATTYVYKTCTVNSDGTLKLSGQTRLRMNDMNKNISPGTYYMPYPSITFSGSSGTSAQAVDLTYFAQRDYAFAIITGNIIEGQTKGPTTLVDSFDIPVTNVNQYSGLGSDGYWYEIP